MNSKSSKFVAGLFFVVVSLLFVPNGSFAASSPTSVGIINIGEVLNSTNAGKKAKKKLEAKYSKKVDAKFKELKSIEEKISKRGNLMKDNEKKAIQAEYFSKKKDFEKLREASFKAERAMTKKIVTEALAISKKIAQEEGYSLILEKGSNIIFAVDSLDITQKVIKRHNAEYKGK